VRSKIASSQERAGRLRSELLKAKEMRAVQQSRLAEQELSHGRACAESSALLEFNGTVCGELGKLWQALEEVVRTLGNFSSQWSRQLQSANDPTTSWMGRGVLSELMASSAEILERMRELKRLRRLAARDPCRRPGDGLTGRSTVLRESVPIWEVREP